MDKRQAFISEIKRAALALIGESSMVDPRKVFDFLREEMDKNEATKNHASIGYMDLLIRSGGLRTSQESIEFIRHIR